VTRPSGFLPFLRTRPHSVRSTGAGWDHWPSWCSRSRAWGFTDSTALGTLIRINRRAAEHGARCEIRNVPDRLHRLLAMTGLDRDLILT
jgi:hypothetical protein